MSLLLAAALLPAIAAAAPPKATISGPTAAIAGEILCLDASASEEATHFLWRVSPELPGRKQLEPIDDGSRCRVATFPGIWNFMLVASNAEGADIAYATVTIPGGSPMPPGPAPGPNPSPPTPGPAPTPPTPPNPPTPQPLPAGEFAITHPVYDLARAVSDPQRSQKLQVLAVAGEALAAKVAAGTITKAQTLLQELASQLDATVDDQHGWSEFRKSVSAELERAYTQNKTIRLKVGFAGDMTDPSGWAALLREMSTGLKAAASAG